MGARYVFTCEACGESMTVDADVRDLIVAAGCAYCGAPAGAGAFTPAAD